MQRKQLPATQATPEHTLSGLKAGWCALLLGLIMVAHSHPAQAQGAAIFRGADLALGEQLIREHQCVQCHANRVGGDGSSIFRPTGRINTAGLLRGMVEQCNATLNFQMFPEEVTAVAAVLNRDHYKFSD